MIRPPKPVKAVNRTAMKYKGIPQTEKIVFNFLEFLI